MILRILVFSRSVRRRRYFEFGGGSSFSHSSGVALYTRTSFGIAIPRLCSQRSHAQSVICGIFFGTMSQLDHGRASCTKGVSPMHSKSATVIASSFFCLASIIAVRSTSAACWASSCACSLLKSVIRCAGFEFQSGPPGL